MQSIKITTPEAQKQRLSRNVRAECNADMLLMSILLGAELHFGRTKMTSFAKKVYVGQKCFFDDFYSNDEITEKGVLFEAILRKLWDESKLVSCNDMLVNKNILKQYENDKNITEIVKEKLSILRTDAQTDPRLVLWNKQNQQQLSFSGNECCCLRKRKTKNKEASFCNFLSYKLSQHGISLMCQRIARKMTTKTLHFFIWKKYILPNGEIIKSEDLLPITTKLRNYLDNECYDNRLLVLNKDTLEKMNITNEDIIKCGLGCLLNNEENTGVSNSENDNTELVFGFNETIQNKSLSVFKPIRNYEKFTVIESPLFFSNDSYSTILSPHSY